MSFQIPDKQWAQVVDKKGSCTYKEIPVPKPGADEVLVNIKYTGVCHTVGGHEGAGVVVAKGDLVSDDEIKLGDQAGIKVGHDHRIET